MTNLNLEIISPSGIIFNDTCSTVVIPSVDGEMGIMQGHEIIVTNLKEGEISILDERERVLEKFEIRGGFAEVKDTNHVVILVD